MITKLLQTAIWPVPSLCGVAEFGEMSLISAIARLINRFTPAAMPTGTGAKPLDGAPLPENQAERARTLFQKEHYWPTRFCRLRRCCVRPSY
jgi:hypothetical protein